MCDCLDTDRYLCWAKRHELDIDATSTVRNAVIADGGPCLCHCHDGDGEAWTNELQQDADAVSA